MTEITEGNKLIAEFMKNHAVNSPHLKSESELQYHTSWDWLMPVVEKIATIPSISITIESFTVEYGDKAVGSFGIEKTTWHNSAPIKELITYKKEFIEKLSLTENVWQAVIQFIKWYNQNK